jgi:hypothetical protein
LLIIIWAQHLFSSNSSTLTSWIFLLKYKPQQLFHTWKLQMSPMMGGVSTQNVGCLENFIHSISRNCLITTILLFVFFLRGAIFPKHEP